MPVSFVRSSRGYDVLGRRQLHVGKLTLDNSYPTGGYSLTLAILKARNARIIEGVIVSGGNAAAATRKFSWDSVNQKLMAHQTGAALSGVFSETANATDLSAVILDLTIILL